MVSKRISVLIGVVVVAVLAATIFFTYGKTEVTTYSQQLQNEFSAVNSYSGNFSANFTSNLTTNQPFIYGFPKIKFTIESNYSIYRNGKQGVTYVNFFSNMEPQLVIGHFTDNFSKVPVENFSIPPNINLSNGTISKVTVPNVLTVSTLEDYISNHSKFVLPNVLIAFTNSSGLYMCATKPKTLNVDGNSTLNPFMCGRVSGSKDAGLKYMVNLSQLSAPSVGFGINTLNISLKYANTSSYMGQECRIYDMSSEINSSLVSVLYTKTQAYVNGSECVSTSTGMPLYQRINVTIPSHGVYSYYSMSLKSFSNSVTKKLDSFPPGYEYNLKYGNIS